MQFERGTPTEHLTPFGDAARDADAMAFAELMRFIAQYNDGSATVPMVQVENEVGLLRDSRDWGPAAADAHATDIPPGIVSLLVEGAELAVRPEWEARGSRTSGTWAELVGTGIRTGEAFMAWAYARYIGHVATAGRREQRFSGAQRAGPRRDEHDRELSGCAAKSPRHAGGWSGRGRWTAWPRRATRARAGGDAAPTGRNVNRVGHKGLTADHTRSTQQRPWTSELLWWRNS